MTAIVLATKNPGKLKEIQDLCAAWPQLTLKIVSAIPDIIESGTSFTANALLKARHAAYHTNLPAIADDSGLEVDALHGAPGIFSARYAGPKALDQENIIKLLQSLHGIPSAERVAHFHCTAVYVASTTDPNPIICHGTWEGIITTSPFGSHGFGYDPIFYVPSEHCTVAELMPHVKNMISHRAQAFKKLIENIMMERLAR